MKDKANPQAFFFFSTFSYLGLGLMAARTAILESGTAGSKDVALLHLLLCRVCLSKNGLLSISLFYID